MHMLPVALRILIKNLERGENMPCGKSKGSKKSGGGKKK